MSKYKLPMPAVNNGHKMNESSTVVEVKSNTGIKIK